MPSGKDEIRREMRARRKALSAAERAEASAIICAKLAQSVELGEVTDPLDFGFPIAVYLASPDEIDIRAYIERLLWYRCKVVAPRWNGETYELAALKGLNAQHLRRGIQFLLPVADQNQVITPACQLPRVFQAHAGTSACYQCRKDHKYCSLASRESYNSIHYLCEYTEFPTHLRPSGIGTFSYRKESVSLTC